jgi:lipopolysaccharide assembly outer membrane protein LptD (OstA)
VRCSGLVKLLMGLLVFLASASLGIASPPAPGVPTLQEVEMNADRVIYEEKKNLMKLVGNVRFSGKETVVKAPYAEYDYKTRLATMRGGVTFTRPDTVLSSRQIQVYYPERRAVLLGEVHAVTTRSLAAFKDKKLNEEVSGSKSTFSCDRLEFDWAKKEGAASGNVLLEQKKLRIFADQARYSDVGGVAVLTGHVRIERGTDDWLVCNEAVVDLNKETYEAQGAVHGKYLFEEKTANPLAPGPSPSPSPDEKPGSPKTTFGEKIDGSKPGMLLREKMEILPPPPIEQSASPEPGEGGK